MDMNISKRLCEDYTRIEFAIDFIRKNYNRQPDLNEIAGHISMSPFHFQKLFTRWAGISPKKFVQFLTLQYAKSALYNSRSIFETALDSGLSGSSRLHDLFVNFEAMSPGEYKNKGKDLEIAYSFYPSPFGEYMLAVTSKGICGLIFVDKGSRLPAIKTLKERWPLSIVYESRDSTEPYVSDIDNQLIQKPVNRNRHAYFLKGTPFQIKVWQALLKIPFGTLVSYRDVAVMIGMPTSVRAVANAISINSIAFLIPCHRVINSSGLLGGYRWGMERKMALIGWEASHQQEYLNGNPKEN